VPIPALPSSPPQLLPVPSAWWETPAVTSRPLSPVPEEARTARQFVRELLTCWGLAYLSDDAELIIAELVGNAVRHGVRTAPQFRSAGAEPSVLRLCLLRRVGEVMLAVTDPSDEAPTPRAPSFTGESGRGLQIVGALSYVWGWSPIEGHGKAVWAVLKSCLPGDRYRPRDRRLPSRRLVDYGKHVLDQGDQDVLGGLPRAGVAHDDGQLRVKVQCYSHILDRVPA
jgi:Histidine kinase-like ATPase domain